MGIQLAEMLEQERYYEAKKLVLGHCRFGGPYPCGLIWRACSPASPNASGSAGRWITARWIMGAPIRTPASKAYLDEQNTIMSTMMDDMGNIQHSGSAAVDFLAGMIPHHASAISMAESYLNNGGSHPELKPLAESIITAQKAEIDEMKAMIQERETTAVKNEEQESAYLDAYNKLMLSSHAVHTDGDSLDEAFARGDDAPPPDGGGHVQCHPGSHRR